ncbi:DUF58 domain-containing protein [Ancylomarina sp.]|uniref:DUF58 domain-containing protein n=1 Tax=Ancylomarina sp. TaxID=1970196 RepID=UPI00356449EB
MNFIKSLYLTERFYMSMIGIVVLALLGHFIPLLFPFAKIIFLLFLALVVVDSLMLYRSKKGLYGKRICPEKLSNGDENPIDINIENNYPFTVNIKVIDEVPLQFQMRDFESIISLRAGHRKTISYNLRPVERGEYQFGHINLFAATPLGLIQRRYQEGEKSILPVYPSFMQMRQYELLAISNRLSELGVKKVRRIGHQMEFDQIREYVRGDDYRTINWKATARKSQLMVNQYQDEKSQPVYSIIDMGRSMKMPFNGLSLLDYAINASLVISNTASLKQDKTGLITFNKEIEAIVPANSQRTHILKIMEVLYNQKTSYSEPNFELLHATIRHRIPQRSLLILFTNFESLESMKRQLPYLTALSRHHLLVVVFFSNSEIKEMIKKPAKTQEEIYIKTIGEKFIYDKKQIVKELERYGIHSLMSDPQNVTINTLNKYLELKARGLI